MHQRRPPRACLVGVLAIVWSAVAAAQDLVRLEGSADEELPRAFAGSMAPSDAVAPSDDRLVGDHRSRRQPESLAPRFLSDAMQEEIPAPGAARITDANDETPPDPLWHHGTRKWISPEGTVPDGPPTGVAETPPPARAWRVPGRYRGPGQGLDRESWLTRPYHVDLVSGALFGDDPIQGRINAGAGYFVGARLGWDWAHYWGFETRLAISTVGLEDPRGIRQFGDSRIYLGDVSLLFYPWGDTRWRPFFSTGMGFADVRLVNDLNVKVHETLFGLPFGGGIKYRFDGRLTFRMEVMDNVAFGSGSRLDTLHNVTLSAGMEYHFGGRSRKSYFPWNPGRGWW